MTTYDTATAGDIGDYRGPITLDGVDTLTNADRVYARVWRPGDVTVTLDATILDAAARTVRLDLGDNDGWLANLRLPAGHIARYNVAWSVEFTDGSLWTWGEVDTLPVRGRP